MKKTILINILLVSTLIGLILTFNYIDNRNIFEIQVPSKTLEEPLKEEVVFDGMTLKELAAKLDRSLRDDLSGTGYLYAKYSIEYGVDPYLAVAISLHETGCNNTSKGCSYLVSECNNVGGMKFKPSCSGGSFGRNDTLDEGIERFIRNIAYNYIEYGLDTPLKMQAKYEGTGSKTWAPTVERYMASIKNA